MEENIFIPAYLKIFNVILIMFAESNLHLSGRRFVQCSLKLSEHD